MHYHTVPGTQWRLMDIGFGEIVLILGLALILLGPKKLPKAARSWSRMIHKLKRDIDSALDDK